MTDVEDLMAEEDMCMRDVRLPLFGGEELGEGEGELEGEGGGEGSEGDSGSLEVEPGERGESEDACFFLGLTEAFIFASRLSALLFVLGEFRTASSPPNSFASPSSVPRTAAAHSPYLRAKRAGRKRQLGLGRKGGRVRGFASGRSAPLQPASAAVASW
jgi:hypothetical protein